MLPLAWIRIILDIPNPCRDKWLETTGVALNPCECVTAVSEEFDNATLNRILSHYRFRKAEGKNGGLQFQTFAKKSFHIPFAVSRFYHILKIGRKNGIDSYVSGKIGHLGLFHLKTTSTCCSIGVVLDAIEYFILRNKVRVFMV